MNNQEFYHKMLKQFVVTSKLPNIKLYASDNLTQYLWQVMADEGIKQQVLNDDIAARIFEDSMMQLVCLYLQKLNYHKQRCRFEEKQIADAEQWSLAKRKEEYQALLQHIATNYAAQGFDIRFYQHEFQSPSSVADDALWQSLLNDWKRCLTMQMQQRNNTYFDSRKELQCLLLHNNLKAAPAYVRQHNISKQRFFQSWALMGGRWNQLEYERLQSIVSLQQKYPVLEQITATMGRKADSLGAEQIGYTSGCSERMEHASHSDITGISIGRDLSALLPLELAQFSDTDMEDLFFKKYVTNHLQTFGYQSKTINAAQGLHRKPARPHGPMVVCMDTSASMAGLPNQIALSLMMRLSEMCEAEQRDCLLIAFSVLAVPIDVLHDRTQLLQFFTRRAAGNTDSRKMLDALFTLFSSEARYVGADVLWITDFRIPMPQSSYLCQMERLRQCGTRFYGLQIGIAQNHWLPYFDQMFQITDYQ